MAGEAKGKGRLKAAKVGGGEADRPEEEKKKRKRPGGDQFIEGKIGSGYLATIAGQPNLDEFARELEPGLDTRNRIKQVREKTPGPVEH